MERFSALVLSQDRETLHVINKAFEEYGMEANIVSNVREANELLKGQRFDLAVCDYDSPGMQQFAYLEPASAWRGMVFALVRQDQISRVRGQRVHLTMPKPLSQGLFGKGLRAAYATMAHERRVAFRYPVNVQVSDAELVTHGEHLKLDWARILNISRTGMCLQTQQMLPQHTKVQVTFELPENGGLISVEGDAVWTKAPGQSGIRFRHLPETSQTRLTQWLESKLPPEFSA